MEKIKGLLKDFKNAKIVYMTTFSENSEEHSRQMTNFNTNPYRTMWFPTENTTQKVRDIKKNSQVLLTFPREQKEEYYEIKGEASLEDPKIVEKKWRWWYLYWHPSQKRRFWFPATGKHPNRAIINIHPISVRIIKKD